ncbi:hypothetical protein [Legionella sp. W05-934-2]|uniref:hypothetical protein n=1 Tax=Legionella sp. W05-934-2 TaxID=1198649 RepID=UPI0034631EBF
MWQKYVASSAVAIVGTAARQAFTANEVSDTARTITPHASQMMRYASEGKNPALLYQLPLCIAKNAVPFLGSNQHEFQDPHRRELQQHCDEKTKNLISLDDKTVGPVNRLLDKMGIPLTEEAKRAIATDITMTKDWHDQLDFSALIKNPGLLAQYCRDMAENQGIISNAFYTGKEEEGAAAHKGLQCAFALAGSKVERALKVASAVTGKDYLKSESPVQKPMTDESPKNVMETFKRQVKEMGPTNTPLGIITKKNL